MMRLLPFLIPLGIGTGCTFAVHQNHTSDFVLAKPLSEHRTIEARDEQQVILGITGQTDYVDNAYRRLMNQCEGGTVTGIQSRYSTSHSFLSWTNVVHMWGYCSE